MLEKLLVWAGAIGTWLSLTFWAMAVCVGHNPGILWYAVAGILSVVLLRVGLWLGE